MHVQVCCVYFLPLRTEGTGTPWSFHGGCRSSGSHDSMNGMHVAGPVQSLGSTS